MADCTLTCKNIILPTSEEYLGKVKFTAQDNIKSSLVTQMFPHYDQTLLDISGVITNFLKDTECKPKCSDQNWVDIKPEKLNEYAIKELNSTAYILRVLTNAVIVANEKTPTTEYINFTSTTGTLTGNWENDKTLITMTIQKKNVGPPTDKGKLIMGFGPSASGKSFNAETIIDIMGVCEPTFDTIYFIIDGGEYRKYSVVYQSVLKAIQENNTARKCNFSLNNLNDIFNTSGVKKIITQYLSTQNKNNPISLYVPDTLNTCAVQRKCDDNIQSYINITNSANEWVSMMIYQHLDGTGGCVFNPPYKCNGTKVDGTSRERCESKKYDAGFLGSSYTLAYKTGNEYLKEGLKLNPKYVFRIHNAGTPTLDEIKIMKFRNNVFEDLTDYKNDKTVQHEIESKILDKGMLYVEGKIKNNSMCRRFFNDKNANLCTTQKDDNETNVGGKKRTRKIKKRKRKARKYRRRTLKHRKR